jgi:hypothetical protein
VSADPFAHSTLNTLKLDVKVRIWDSRAVGGHERARDQVSSASPARIGRGSSWRITDHERLPTLVGFDAKDAEPRYAPGGQRRVEDTAEAVGGEGVVC